MKCTGCGIFGENIRCGIFTAVSGVFRYRGKPAGRSVSVAWYIRESDMDDHFDYHKDFIPKGTELTYDMLEKDGESFIWKLRKLQDSVLYI